MSGWEVGDEAEYIVFGDRRRGTIALIHQPEWATPCIRSQSRPCSMFEWVTPHTLRRTVATVVADEYGTEVAAEQLGNTRAVLERHYRERRAQAPDVTAALDALAPVRAV